MTENQAIRDTECHQLKVVLLGLPSVGKTALFNRFINDCFYENSEVSLPGSNCFGCRVMPDFGVKIALWDTAGSEKFFSLTSSYYRNSSAVLLCYSMLDYKTLVNASLWISDLKSKVPDAKVFLCGCKTDLMPDQLAIEKMILTVKSFARQNNIPTSQIHQVSSKTGEGVETLFQSVAAACKPKLEQSIRQKSIAEDNEGQRPFTISDEVQQQQQQHDSNSRFRVIRGFRNYCSCL